MLVWFHSKKRVACRGVISFGNHFVRNKLHSLTALLILCMVRLQVEVFLVT